MSRKFIAAIVGAALTVTAIGTAPARANEDVLRALAIIAGVAVVGKVASDRLGRDDKNKTVVSRNRFDESYFYDYSGDKRVISRDNRVNSRDSRIIRRVEPRPLPRDVRRRLLPGECLRSWKTRYNRARVFDEKCLTKNYAYTKSLPRACEVKVRAKNKKRRGFDVRCLRRNGYQLARR